MTETTSNTTRVFCLVLSGLTIASLLTLTPAFAARKRVPWRPPALAARRRAPWRYPLRPPARRQAPRRGGKAGAATAARLLGVCGRPVVGALAFSSDGSRLAAGSGSALSSASPGEVRIWEVASGHVVYTVPYPAPVCAVAYAPLSDMLAVSTVQSQVMLWSVTAPARPLLRTLAHPHASGGLCLAFTRDGDLLATGGGDLAGSQYPGEARLWQTSSGALVRTIPCPGRTVVSLQFSPRRGDCLIASRGLGPADHGVLEVWSPSLRARRWSRPASDLVGAALVDLGDSVAGVQAESSGKQYRLRVRLWSGAFGRPLNSYVIPMGGWAISPDGRQLACTGVDLKSVAVRDARTGRVRQKLSCDFAPEGLSFAFSNDGRRLAAGTQDGTVLLWTLKPPIRPNLDARSPVSKITP